MGSWGCRWLSGLSFHIFGAPYLNPGVWFTYITYIVDILNTRPAKVDIVLMVLSGTLRVIIIIVYIY